MFFSLKINKIYFFSQKIKIILFFSKITLPPLGIKCWTDTTVLFMVAPTHNWDSVSELAIDLTFYHFTNINLNRNVFEKLYMCFIRPNIEYADVVWLGAHKTDLIKLDMIQNHAMRIVKWCIRQSNINRLYIETNCQRLELWRK